MLLYKRNAIKSPGFIIRNMASALWNILYFLGTLIHLGIEIEVILGEDGGLLEEV